MHLHIRALTVSQGAGRRDQMRCGIVLAVPLRAAQKRQHTIDNMCTRFIGLLRIGHNAAPSGAKRSEVASLRRVGNNAAPSAARRSEAAGLRHL